MLLYSNCAWIKNVQAEPNDMQDAADLSELANPRWDAIHSVLSVQQLVASRRDQGHRRHLSEGQQRPSAWHSFGICRENLW